MSKRTIRVLLMTVGILGMVLLLFAFLGRQVRPDKMQARATPHLKVNMPVPTVDRKQLKSVHLVHVPARLIEDYASLRSKSSAGDSQATSQLFRDTRRCALVRALERDLVEEHEQLTVPLRNESFAQQIRDRVAKQEAFVQSNTAFCEGAESALDADPREQALQAARLGDSLAADCFVGTNLFQQADLFDHPQYLTEYKANALAIAQASVDAGNARMAERLGEAYAGQSRDPLALLVGRDPVQAYRYLKLFRLTQPPDDPAGSVVDGWLLDAGGSIDPATQAEADAWAQHMFDSRFHSTQWTYKDLDAVNCDSLPVLQ